MKKIAFVIKNMKMGGTRVSLLSLLEVLGKNSDNLIDLYILNHSGTLIDNIPRNINVIKESKIVKISICDKKDISTINEYIVRAIFYVLKRIFGYQIVYGNLFKRYVKKNIFQNYDVVIGYQEGESNDFSTYIPGKKHIIWYHSNYSNYYKYEKSNKLKDLFQKVDDIIFVASESQRAFNMKETGYSFKTRVIENILPVNRIIQLSKQNNEEVYSNRNEFKLISVGRLSFEKGFDRVISVAKKLKEEEKKFLWIIVGNGNLLEELKESAKTNGVDEYVKFIGERRNPYQIMKQADVVVLPSRSESQPLVALEGLILGKPYVSTNFDSAKEVLDLSSGIIIDNSEKGIYEGIIQMMNRKKFEEKKIGAQKFEYSNKSVMDKIYNLIKEG